MLRGGVAADRVADGTEKAAAAVVSAAEVQEDFGRYREATPREPLIVVTRGKPSMATISVEECERLKEPDRRVMRLDEMTDAQIEEMVAAEILHAPGYSIDDTPTRSDAAAQLSAAHGGAPRTPPGLSDRGGAQKRQEGPALRGRRRRPLGLDVGHHDSSVEDRVFLGQIQQVAAIRWFQRLACCKPEGCVPVPARGDKNAFRGASFCMVPKRSRTALTPTVFL